MGLLELSSLMTFIIEKNYLFLTSSGKWAGTKSNLCLPHGEARNSYWAIYSITMLRGCGNYM